MGPRAGAAAAAPLPLAAPSLQAGPGQPPIIARSVWADGGSRPSVPAGYGSVRLAFVHHTVSPNGYASGDVPSILRSIFDYHRYVRGFHDIAYNFMIDAFGRIWEARAGGIDLPVIGAQAGGYNAVSTGVAVVGTFMDVAPPAAAIAALERLLAWKLSLHGLPTRGRVTVEVNPADAFYTPFAPGAHVSLPRIAGHRDGDSTDCPGNTFYARLPAIRVRATALATGPAKVTLKAPPAAVLAGATVGLSGRLATRSGQPITGAPIEVQQIASGRETTLQTLTTETDGAWGTEIALSYNTTLRALHRPQPATVSDLLVVSVAPRVSLTVESGAPLRVAGEVTPQKRSVTIDAYRLQGAHRRLVASKQVIAQGGRFATTSTIRRPGRYLLIARTRADARNAAGASPAAQVTV